jgi:hypothetical protein
VIYIRDDLDTYTGRKADLTGGVLLKTKEMVAVTISNTGCGIIVDVCDRGGYNDAQELIVSTAATFVGGSIPTSVVTGTAAVSGCYLSPYDTPAVRDERRAVIIGRTYTCLTNSAATMDRKGQIWSGWVPDTGITDIELGNTPGLSVHDGAMLNDGDRPICVRPPWAGVVNDSIASEGLVYTGSAAGYNIMYMCGFPAGSVIQVECITSIFYYGSRVPVEIVPTFSQAAYDCALTCFVRTLGRSSSFVVAQRPTVRRDMIGEASMHGFKHAVAPVANTFWSQIKNGAKKGLSWLAKEAAKVLFM